MDRGAGRSEHSGSSHGREIEWSQQSMSDDDEMKTARKVPEIDCNYLPHVE
jgi:hypothetical protein